jgi:hypothetical protein
MAERIDNVRPYSVDGKVQDPLFRSSDKKHFRHPPFLIISI